MTPKGDQGMAAPELGNLAEPAEQSSRPTNVILLSSFGGFFGLYAPYAALSGEIRIESSWGWIALPIIQFLMFGFLLQSAAEARALLTGDVESFRSGKVFNWWVGRVALRLLAILAGLGAIALAWFMLSGLYEGFRKGPAIITFVLLFMLFAARQVARRR